MYLAITTTGGQARYHIRESIRRDGNWLYRDLFDLGPAPQRFIVYPGGNAFYIDKTVEETLQALGLRPGIAEMEALFWPFVRPDIQRKIEPFRRRESGRRRAKETGPAIRAEDTHLFDRRRIHFLKFGKMDQKSLVHLPASSLRRLGGKSRDEIEQDFIRLEAVLKPHEFKTYTYVSFNLQQVFSQGFAKQNPEWLDQDQVDAAFIDGLCALQQDAVFWAGMDPGPRLNAYLVRYALMFFDHGYAPPSPEAAWVQDFINRHRRHRTPPAVALSLEKACALLDCTTEQLRQMTRRDLSRRYRRRARDLHPDRGGRHADFVALTEAYQRLLRVKKGAAD